MLVKLLIGCLLVGAGWASIVTEPFRSAVVIGFEKSYEQSLLAQTLVDNKIATTFIVTGRSNGDFHKRLNGMELISLNVDASTPDKEALDACEKLLTDIVLQEYVQQTPPTFVVFPALRHDACLLPWVESISSIPVIVTYGSEEELYAVHKSGVALPTHSGGPLDGYSENKEWLRFISRLDNSYVTPASKIAWEHITKAEYKLEDLYRKVELIFSNSDPVLGTNYARLGHMPVHIGCHYCRGANPLPSELQKKLVEYRSDTVVVTLDESYVDLVMKVAKNLPQGRQGRAVAWRNRWVDIEEENRPENLIVYGAVDRQDLIGYARARVLLSHCEESVLLETGFHGTPVICIPRNSEEARNAKRAIELGFSVALEGKTNVDSIVAGIERIYTAAKYREVARSVSSFIRDRPLPASDELIYWLEHAARNAGRSVKLPTPRADEVRTFAQDANYLWDMMVNWAAVSILMIIAIGLWKVWRPSRRNYRRD